LYALKDLVILDRFIQLVDNKEMIPKDEIRETILAVASEIFSRYGYQKTTMDDIARATGKGKSSIYYYFKNKEEIFREVVEKEVLVLKSKILVAINAQTDPREKLKAHILVRMKGLKNFLNLYNALKNDFLSHFEFCEQLRTRYDKEEIGIIKEILDAGVKNGEFQIDDTSVTAMVIVTAMKGLEIPLLIETNPDTHVEIRLDKLLDVFFYGILIR